MLDLTYHTERSLCLLLTGSLRTCPVEQLVCTPHQLTGTRMCIKYISHLGADATPLPFLKVVKSPSALPIHVEPLKLRGLAVDCPERQNLLLGGLIQILKHLLSTANLHRTTYDSCKYIYTLDD